MPKQIAVPEARFTRSEVYSCLEAAGKAAGKRPKLGEKELLAIAIVAWDSSLIVPMSVQYLWVTEDADHDPSGICQTLARRLAWAFFLDADTAFRAFDAARREGKRIRKTNTWMTLEVIRSMIKVEAFRARWFRKSRSNFYLQRVIEGVEERFSIRVTQKTIHKALRLEREMQDKWKHLPHGLDLDDWPDEELRSRLR